MGPLKFIQPAAQPRWSLDKGTWLDPEEMAYNVPLSRSPRKAGVLIDGEVCTVTVGIPDTYFTIPAWRRVAGRRVRGYATIKDGALVFVQTGDGDV